MHQIKHREWPYVYRRVLHSPLYKLYLTQKDEGDLEGTLVTLLTYYAPNKDQLGFSTLFSRNCLLELRYIINGGRRQYYFGLISSSDMPTRLPGT